MESRRPFLQFFRWVSQRKLPSTAFVSVTNSTLATRSEVETRATVPCTHVPASNDTPRMMKCISDGVMSHQFCSSPACFVKFSIFTIGKTARSDSGVRCLFFQFFLVAVSDRGAAPPTGVKSLWNLRDRSWYLHALTRKRCLCYGQTGCRAKRLFEHEV